MGLIKSIPISINIYWLLDLFCTVSEITVTFRVLSNLYLMPQLEFHNDMYFSENCVALRW